jgi:hypothetical protein
MFDPRTSNLGLHPRRSAGRARRGVVVAFWSAFTGAVAMTVAVRQTRLLPGEVAMMRWARERLSGVFSDAGRPSRLVEVDHWPADVVAGYLIAIMGLAGAIWLDHRLPSVLAKRTPRLHELLHLAPIPPGGRAVPRAPDRFPPLGSAPS